MRRSWTGGDRVSSTELERAAMLCARGEHVPSDYQVVLEVAVRGQAIVPGAGGKTITAEVCAACRQLYLPSTASRSHPTDDDR
ncbi:MAG: hypothetical protein IT379_42400 [Deltaproteobacteria bacterium]|nr:hypothetical protein [Deltaproteobacteria bacterium]